MRFERLIGIVDSTTPFFYVFISLIGIIPLGSLLVIEGMGTLDLKSELGGDNGDYFDDVYLF